MIINLGFASVDNHIPKGDISDYYTSLKMPIDMRVTFFTIALRVIDEKTITCTKPMRVRFILLEVFPLQINDSSEPQLGCVKLPITLLFVDETIKCGYSFS